MRVTDNRKTSVVSRMARRAVGGPARPIPVFWFSGFPNFGDSLSAVIVEHMSHGTPVLVSPRFRGKLLAVGSILNNLREGDFVWGSGAICSQPIAPPPDVSFCAVRGPLTRNLIRADVPEVYGDPAMLLPRVYAPRGEKRFDIGLIPHYVDRSALQVSDPSIVTIDVQADWHSVVERISECKVILSSSLHGLIVAEAYGIPAAWITITDNVKGQGFKFRDYYMSTSREPPNPIPWSIALRTVDRYIDEPPMLEVEPLLKAWPASFTFPVGV